LVGKKEPLYHSGEEEKRGTLGGECLLLLVKEKLGSRGLPTYGRSFSGGRKRIPHYNFLGRKKKGGKLISLEGFVKSGGSSSTTTKEKGGGGKKKKSNTPQLTRGERKGLKGRR